MRSNRSFALVVHALLVFAFACAGFPVTAGDWTPITREQALEQTRSTQLDKRRLAYGRLAEIGTMDDIPVLLAALWDEEELIRGIAEQSVWGIWMRTDDPVADPLFQTGMQLIVEDDPQAAIEKLNQVIELKPEFAEAWNRRGDAYAALGDEDRALADYERAIVLNPYEFGTLASCGAIWMTRSNYRKAAEYFRRALDLNPNLPEAAEALHALEEKLENDRI
jgi:tetratricopeptide (TPR) repeat protein